MNRTNRGSFGPLLDAFRAVDSPALFAADVTEHAPDLTAADARAALRQLEVDGVAMSTELRCGSRLWWLEAYSGGDTLGEARESQRRYRETQQAAAAIGRGAHGD